MNAFEFHDVSYRFPDAERVALDRVSWHAKPGDKVLVVGPSGSGKSTLLRCLNGLVPHFHGGRFAGRVVVLGQDTRVAGPRELAQRVGSVFQDPEAQTVSQLVEDELAFGMENLGVPRAEMLERIEHTCAWLEIEHLRHRETDQLSGGERQVVALAAALVTQPSLLILDEPTSQLDPLAAARVLRTLERVGERFGAAVVVAEHRLERLLPWANSVVTVQDGVVAASARAEATIHGLPEPPPLVALGKRLGWSPLPITIQEARTRLNGWRTETPNQQRSQARHGAPLLEARGLGFRYRAEPALDEVDLAIHPGDVIALMGPNGSGKTTLLKLLTGLLRPESGEVWVNGQPASRRRSVSEIARVIGYVPQHASLILHQETLEEELRFTLSARGQSGDIGAMLEMVGLAGYGDRHPLDLSGGERQRAALAAIAVGAPPVLLLDEPTRGLPAGDKERLAEFIRRWAGQGRAVLVATHDAEFVAGLAGWVVMLEQGRVASQGTPERVLAGHPVYAPVMNRLLGGSVLTLEDACQVLARPAAAVPTPV